MTRRVVITGLGPVTSIGTGRESFWDATCSSRNGISTVERWDTSRHDVHFGGEIKDFDPGQWFDRKQVRRTDLFVQYALAAADLAMKDSGVDPESLDRTRAGCVVGSGIGGLTEIEKQLRTLFDRGPHKVSAMFVPKMMINAASGEMAIRYRFGGPNFAAVSACASATHAMGLTFRLVRSGEADFMLCGGTEAALTAVGMAGFCSMKALSTRNDDPGRASRPFDRDRDGFVMGEGAGILVFEDLQHALSREAHIYAEVFGFGMTDDCHHITAPAPEGEGAAEAMRLALAEGKVAPADVQYVNAHGTSTKFNDAMESRAIKAVFGDDAGSLAVSSSKSQIGHLLGASGGAELIATVLAVENDIIPPTINYENPDPDCDLDYVPNEARPAKVEKAICNSFGFGGHNTCILVGKYHG